MTAPQHDMDQREVQMKRDVMMVATAGLSLVNGMHFSPWFDPVAILMKPFIAGTFFSTPLVFLYLVSIFISAMTLLLAGVPAALFERWKGLKETSPTSLYIWFAGTLLLTVHALMAAVR
jgi:hypothetical protein